MPETTSAPKIDFKKLGPIRLMPLDTAALFMPFGRPVADYLRAGAGKGSGLTRHPALEFESSVAWQESLDALVRATALAEEEPPVQPAAPEPEPGRAGFLNATHDLLQPRSGDPAPKWSGPLPPHSAVQFPKVEALPLRSRMTLGPAPKPAGPKPAPVAKAAPPAPAQPAGTKLGPVAVAKPASAPAAKAPSPAKPVVTPPASRAAVVEKPPENKKAAPSQSPAPSPAEAPAKESAKGPAPPPVKAAAKPAPAPPAPAKPAQPQIAKAQPAPPERTETLRSEALRKEEPPVAPAAPARPALEPTQFVDVIPSFGAKPEEGVAGGVLNKLPMAAKVGVPVVAVALIGFLLFSGESAKTEATASAVQAASLGGQGWVTEWASDTVGSRRARQLQLYRPSMTLSDYRLEFTGAIEQKAMGWIFRAADTKNYYAMKIERTPASGYQITRFAVVDGRESSNSSKPLPVTGPGGSFMVKLDVSGPRFTVYVQGQPVDFWTDNRLKSGGVGFINERDERAVNSSVKFSTVGVSGK